MKNFKLLLMGLSVVAWSCTDLEVEELDSVVIDTQETGFSGVDVPGT